MAEPTITTLKSLTIHKGIKDKKAYETLMKQGEIKEGDICFIEAGGTSGNSDLPYITEEDNGKFLQVENGEWVAKKLPVYDEKYSVTPSAESQTLSTAGKTMMDDLTVEEIPYYEVSNEEGGTTINIG